MSPTEETLWAVATLIVRGFSVMVILAASVWAVRKTARILRGEAFFSG